MTNQATATELEQFATSLDEDIRQRHPWVHSRWSQLLLTGKLSRQNLQEFALEFEHFLRAAPRHFFCLGSNCPDIIPDDHDLRRIYALNLLDDMGVVEREKDHFQKFRNFCYHIGLKADQLERSVPLPSTIAFNVGLMYLARNLPHEEAIAALQWATESLFYLRMTEPWEKALIEQYGIPREKLFLPPIEEEEEHVMPVRKAVLEYATSTRAQERIREVFRVTFSIWSVFFEGLYHNTIENRGEDAVRFA